MNTTSNNIAFHCFVVAISIVANSAIAEQPAELEHGNCKVKDRADVLLITSKKLADSWDAFADWKTKTGRPTKIITVETIGEKFEGDDIQEKIRACCLSHIEHQKTRWVILGGDSRGRKGGEVPDRDTDHSGFFKYKNIPTDIYYLSAGDWDANDDGVFGQFDEDLDAVNYTNPKATIGRIPVNEPADVLAYTEKVVEYESNYPTGKFANQMIYTCAEAHANAKMHSSKDKVTEAWNDGDIQQFFVGNTPWDGDEEGDHDLSAENWISMINDKKAAKIHMHGHGLNHLWVLENQSMVTKETIDELENDAAYPVMTTVSCFTGQYDAFRDPCITESMLRKKSGGAIAIIAPSREGIPVFHERSDFKLMMTEGKMDGTTETLTRFWTHALKDDMNLGEAFRAAKSDMETHARKTDGYHFVQCELNLLGDPTLDVRAKAVHSISPTAKFENGSVTVEGAKGCEVCVWSGDKVFETSKADSNGNVKFDGIKPGKEVHVSAYQPNMNTWNATVTE